MPVPSTPLRLRLKRYSLTNRLEIVRVDPDLLLVVTKRGDVILSLSRGGWATNQVSVSREQEDESDEEEDEENAIDLEDSDDPDTEEEEEEKGEAREDTAAS